MPTAVTPSSRALVVATYGIVALLSLLNLRGLREQTQAPITSPDPFGVLRQEERFRGVIAMLPAVSQVGYLPEPDVDAFTAETDLLGARDAFAPRMLVQQAESPQQLVIGDFSGAANPSVKPGSSTTARFASVYASVYGLRVVRDFGDGIVLFERNGGQ